MKNIESLLLLLFIISSPLNALSQCYPDQSDNYWRIGSAYGSHRVSNCANTAPYNCHGFIRSYFEAGCQPSLGSFITTPYPCPPQTVTNEQTAWQTNGKYVRVCSEANANVVFYDVTGSGGAGHSAVRLGTTGKYMSKYGADGPLVSHDLNGTFYHLRAEGNSVNSSNFWSYIGSISGNSSVIGTGNQTYSVLSKPGVSYSWTMYSGGDKLYISSATNQNTVTLSPLHSGVAVLRLSSTNSSPGCGGTTVHQNFSINVQTNICLEGSYSTPNVSNQNLWSGNSVPANWVTVNVTCPNATSYIWQKTSGSISYYSSGANASFTMTSGGLISFLVTAKNSSNVTLGTRNISFYNYGSFMAFPNPATTSLKIDVREDVALNIVLFNASNYCVKEVQSYEAKSSIDISDLEKGNYIVHVYMAGKLINKQRIKIDR
jgi:hypothetical protein